METMWRRVLNIVAAFTTLLLNGVSALGRGPQGGVRGAARNLRSVVEDPEPRTPHQPAAEKKRQRFGIRISDSLCHPYTRRAARTEATEASKRTVREVDIKPRKLYKARTEADDIRRGGPFGICVTRL